MARKSPAEKLQALLRVTRAWEALRPGRSFFGYTLERFKQAIQPSLDARAKVEDLRERLRDAIRERIAADVRSFRIVRGVVYSVQADPDESGDGDLYVRMGYVPWRARGRPRLRRTRRVGVRR